ncbi:ribosomal RNA methyltransferase-like protein [Leishmania tarentolae]|uniref:rRNA methyltransferase 2, mitochondrial n=1 Tax=Leishmania tarentolae TaxID=5689 RepID=A0A640KGV8_LEITA|nr:ribosomal RNA methyltransferase-like protein [Leishmania tarentolae]
MRATLVRWQGASRQWMQRQSQDSFVTKARQDGYVARSAYKLTHIDDRFNLFDRQHTRVVMDLGCSPGGWCQVIRERAGDHCFLLGVDLLPMKAQIPNAVIVQGDFTEIATQEKLVKYLAQHSASLNKRDATTEAALSSSSSCFTKVDVVTSDMCPNRMGGSQDRQRIAQLNLKAIDACAPLLRTGGHFVCKVLGSRAAYEELWGRLSRLFLTVHTCKPPASRMHSDEAFLVAMDKLVTPRPASSTTRSCSLRTVMGTANGNSSGGGHFGLDDWPGFGRPRRRQQRE